MDRCWFRQAQSEGDVLMRCGVVSYYCPPMVLIIGRGGSVGCISCDYMHKASLMETVARI